MNLGIIVYQGIVASVVERLTQREFAATIFTPKAVILKEWVTMKDHLNESYTVVGKRTWKNRENRGVV
jgi:hypothetical protein